MHIKKNTLFLILLILISTITFAIVNIDSFTINSSVNYTNDSNLELGISVSGGTGYQAKFSCNNNDWTTYIDFASTMYFDINNSLNDCNIISGNKTIYVDVNFTDGNTSTANNSIIFDAVSPTITSFSPSGSVTGDGADGQEIIIGLIDDINLSNISISLDRGSTNIYDSNSSKCDINGTTNTCSFTDLSVDRGGTYNYSYIITDKAGNIFNDSNTFTFTDSTPLSTPSKPTGSIRNNNIDLNWVNSTANDFNTFILYKSTQSNFDCNLETLVTYTTNNYYSDTALDENTIYYYKLKLIDFTGNNSSCSDQNSFTTNYNLEIEPTISRTDSSCDSNEWCYSDDPEFSLTLTNSEFSWIYTTNSSTNPSDCTYGIDCNNSPAEFSNIQNGTSYFKVKGCKPTGCTPISTYIIKTDDIDPPGPIPTTTLIGYDVKLTWGAVTDTGGSGLYKYYIYRSENPNFTAGSNTLLNSVENSVLTFTDVTPIKGKTYYYKIKAKDNAGNYSSNIDLNSAMQEIPSDLENFTLTTTIKNSNNKETIYYSSAEDFNLTLIFSQDVNVSLYKTIDDQSTTILLDNNYLTNYTHLFTTSANYKDINFYITASSLIHDMNKEIHLYFDNIKPEINFDNVKDDQEFKEDTKILITASDNKEIDKIEIYLDEVLLGEATKNESKYEYLLNVKKTINANLKAIITDKAGLTNDINKNIKLIKNEEIIDNNENNDLKLEDVVLILNNIITKQNELNGRINNGLVLSDNQIKLKEEADKLISEAEKLLESNLDSANQKTLTAQNRYAQIFDELPSENPVFSTENFGFIIIIIIILIILIGLGGGGFYLYNSGKLNFPKEHPFNKHNLEIDDDVKTKKVSSSTITKLNSNKTKNNFDLKIDKD